MFLLDLRTFFRVHHQLHYRSTHKLDENASDYRCFGESFVVWCRCQRGWRGHKREKRQLFTCTPTNIFSSPRPVNPFLFLMHSHKQILISTSRETVSFSFLFLNLMRSFVVPHNHPLLLLICSSANHNGCIISCSENLSPFCFCIRRVLHPCSYSSLIPQYSLKLSTHCEHLDS